MASGKLFLADEVAMVDFGCRIGHAAKGSAIIFLEGDLGMGKTTLTRGVLRAFGHTGAVKSPTYTLVEPYEFELQRLYHFDLYRLGDPEELEYMGIRDYFSLGNLCLIEWPEKGEGFLPEADMVLSLTELHQGREICWLTNTDRGIEIAHKLCG